MYHSIGVNKKFSTVSPESFEKQLRYLKKHKYRVIPLDEMIELNRSAKDLTGTVSLTFDDGYLDFYVTAFPLLKKYALPATLFVPTGLINKPDLKSGQNWIPMMTIEQVQDVAHSNLISVMPHTVLHKKLHGLSLEQAIDEIEYSRKSVEGWIGKKADIFAYPSGRYTEAIVKFFSENNSWRGAVTVNPGLVTNSAHPFLLPRLPIDSSVGPLQFKMKVSQPFRGKY